MPKQVARHHVYVIELDPAVRNHAKFRAANPPLPYAEAQHMAGVLAREQRDDGNAVWQK